MTQSCGCEGRGGTGWFHRKNAPMRSIGVGAQGVRGGNRVSPARPN